MRPLMMTHAFTCENPSCCGFNLLHATLVVVMLKVKKMWDNGTTTRPYQIR